MSEFNTMSFGVSRKHQEIPGETVSLHYGNQVCVTTNYGDENALGRNYGDGNALGEEPSLLNQYETNATIISKTIYRGDKVCKLRFLSDETCYGSMTYSVGLLNSDLTSDKIGLEENSERITATMSFVGLIRCRNGILAFSDSKTSRRDTQGRLFEDIERGYVPKIFINSQCVFVTCGSNELASKSEYLETFIKENLKEKSFDEFLNGFVDKIRQESMQIEREYLFLVGKKDSAYFEAVKVICHQGKILVQKEKLKDPVCFGGNSFYIEIFDNLKFNLENSIEQISALMKQTYPHMIALGDLFLSYNPVGGPLQLQYFQ